MDMIATHIRDTPIEDLHIRPYLWSQDSWMGRTTLALPVVGGPHHGYKSQYDLDNHQPGVLEIKDNDGGVIASSLVWLYAPRS